MNMIKGSNAAILTDDNGAHLIRLTLAGDAVTVASGEVTDLIEARSMWIDCGGTDEMFDRAVSYVDSCR